MKRYCWPRQQQHPVVAVTKLRDATRDIANGERNSEEEDKMYASKEKNSSTKLELLCDYNPKKAFEL